MQGSGSKLLLELFGIVAAVAALEVVAQLKDPTSPVRLQLAAFWDQVETHWQSATVAEQMHTELDAILEGRLTT